MVLQNALIPTLYHFTAVAGYSLCLQPIIMPPSRTFTTRTYMYVSFLFGPVHKPKRLQVESHLKLLAKTVPLMLKDVTSLAGEVSSVKSPAFLSGWRCNFSNQKMVNRIFSLGQLLPGGILKLRHRLLLEAWQRMHRLRKAPIFHSCHLSSPFIIQKSWFLAVTSDNERLSNTYCLCLRPPDETSRI